MRHFALIYRGQAGPEELAIELDGSRCVLRRGGSAEGAEIARLPDGRLSLLLEDGRQICGRVLAAGNGEVEVVTRAGSRRIALAEPLRDRLAHSDDAAHGLDQDEEIHALMPGRVVEVAVAAGDRVAAGTLLLVLEAMKMQIEIRTARGGTVMRVEVERGRAVDRGTPLVVVRPETRQEGA